MVNASEKGRGYRLGVLKKGAGLRRRRGSGLGKSMEGRG